jgi:hypothetical protein
MGGEGYAWASRLGHWQDLISDMLGGFFLVMFCGLGRIGSEDGGGLLNMLATWSWQQPAWIKIGVEDRENGRIITIRKRGHDRMQMQIERTGQEGVWSIKC